MGYVRLVLPVLTLLCVILSTAHAGKGDHLTEEDERLFAWFDRLDLEDIRPARLVRVRTGDVSYVEEPGKKRQRWADDPRGFLLWEKDGQFRVLLGDLTVATFDRVGTDPTKDDYVGWRKVSPETETKDLLRYLSQKNSDGFWEDSHDVYTDRLKMRAQIFVLARYCAAHEEHALAVKLLRALEDWVRRNKNETLDEYLQDEIADVLSWRASLELANPERDRQANARLFQNIADQCPKRFRGEWHQEFAEALRRMAIEDDAHPKIQEEDLLKLAPEAQARELVFQLRDEYDIPQDMWPRPWPFPPTRGNGALGKLQKLGPLAAPALMAALEDDRPTRAVFRNHRYGGGAWHTKMQDQAAKALNEIAGVNFNWLIRNGGGMEQDARWEQYRSLVADWWKTAERQGTLEWLRSRALEGEYGADYCLEAIAKNHPAALPGLIIVATDKAKDPAARGAMVKMLRKVETRDATELLLREMKQGPTLANRIVAAYILRERHHPGVLATMRAEMPALLAKPMEESRPGPIEGRLRPLSTSPEMLDATEESATHLLGFLFSSDSPEAIRDAQTLLSRMTPAGRAMFLHFRCAARLNAEPNETSEAASPATREAIESMLISMLKDSTILKGMNIHGLQNPRFNEIIAIELAAGWPQKYRFDPKAPSRVRASQLATIRTQAAKKQ